MVEYECFRCGYSTNRKSCLKQHLNRKKICKATEDDISIESIKEFYDFEIYSKSAPNCSKLLQNAPKYK